MSAIPTLVRKALASLAVAAVIGMAVLPASAADLVGDTALLQWLDKVTARISSLKVPVGSTVRVGTLEIKVDRCLKHPPEETPESAAFLEIREVRPGEPPVKIFSGWMFASSPALNALQHPVYDVWVKDCLNAKSPSDKAPE